MDEGLERIQNLLAMILVHDMKDAPQADKASSLSKAGLANAEIAALLGTTPGAIAQQLYALRSSKRAKPSRRAKKHKK